MNEKINKVLLIDNESNVNSLQELGNYPNLPKEVADKVQKMDNVSMVQVEKMIYEFHQNNYEKSLGKKKIRKCSNKKYVKRKKSKNGKRKKK